MKKGKPVFDGIAVGEVSMDFMKTSLHVTAKAAFVDSQTGTTHGWTNCTQWSKETIRKIGDLKASMERDLATVHFQEGLTDEEPIDGVPSGLMEHLSDEEDAPSI
jgi:hypothetical protein